MKGEMEHVKGLEWDNEAKTFKRTKLRILKTGDSILGLDGEVMSEVLIGHSVFYIRANDLTKLADLFADTLLKMISSLEEAQY